MRSIICPIIAIFVLYVRKQILKYNTMKMIFKICIIAATFLFAAEATADAQLLKNLLNKATTTETVSEATTNGQAAGAALKSLYSQYKVDGKLDMNNLTNMLNLATLATNIQGLKGISNKSAFYKDFATGLVTGSNNLINSSNSASVMSGLTSLVNNVDLSELTTTTDNATSAAAASSALSSLLTGSSSASSAVSSISNATEVASSVSSILKLFK